MKLDCKAMDDLLVDFLYDELDASERARVELHLRECAGCAEEMARLAGTRRLMGTLESPAPLRDDTYLMQVAKRQARLASAPKASWGPLGRLLTRPSYVTLPVAGLVLLLVVGVTLGDEIQALFGTRTDSIEMVGEPRMAPPDPPDFSADGAAGEPEDHRLLSESSVGLALEVEAAKGDWSEETEDGGAKRRHEDQRAARAVGRRPESKTSVPLAKQEEDSVKSEATAFGEIGGPSIGRSASAPRVVSPPEARPPPQAAAPPRASPSTTAQSPMADASQSPEPGAPVERARRQHAQLESHAPSRFGSEDRMRSPATRGMPLQEMDSQLFGARSSASPLPDEQQLRLERARSLVAAGRCEQALLLLEGTFEGPEDAVAEKHALRARCFEATGRAVEARDAWQAALDASPGSHFGELARQALRRLE